MNIERGDIDLLAAVEEKRKDNPFYQLSAEEQGAIDRLTAANAGTEVKTAEEAEQVIQAAKEASGGRDRGRTIAAPGITGHGEVEKWLLNQRIEAMAARDGRARFDAEYRETMRAHIDATYGEGTERATSAKIFLEHTIDTEEMRDVLSTEEGYRQATSEQGIDDFKKFEQADYMQAEQQRQADKAHENQGMEI